MAKVESLYGTTPAEIFESGLENAGAAFVELLAGGTVGTTIVRVAE